MLCEILLALTHIRQSLCSDELDLAELKHDQLTKTSRNKDKVERDEFRKMLLYMKYYYLYITFDRVTGRPMSESAWPTFEAASTG